MKIKSPSEIREKKQRIKEKLTIRVVGKTTPKEKKWATWEFELFKKIAKERSLMTDNYWYGRTEYVVAKHITKEWEETTKKIPLDDLTVTNFSHIVSKGRDKTKRLDPNNITIVSRAYHEWQHSLQVPQTIYIN